MNDLLLVRLLRVESHFKKSVKTKRAQSDVQNRRSLGLLLALQVVLSEWTSSGAAADALELSFTPPNGIQPASIDGTRALEKLSPFHNIYPDAYLDPVSTLLAK